MNDDDLIDAPDTDRAPRRRGPNDRQAAIFSLVACLLAFALLAAAIMAWLASAAAIAYVARRKWNERRHR